MMTARIIVMIVSCLCLCACTRVVVHKDPGVHDKGIRYYRPKPYLFIVPGEGGGGGKEPAFTVSQGAPIEIKSVQADPSVGAIKQAAGQTDPQPKLQGLPEKRDKNQPTAPTPTKISISMAYMPDFAEEYSIQLRPGLGIGELNVTLENGWNLTSVGIKTDQQTDEILKSTADLVSSVGGLLKPLGFKEGDPEPPGRILATNIPFGFYEAVIARDPKGKKQLYGWRYVGFMPFQGCPVEAGGSSPVCCGDPSAIYGLVMDKDGIMRLEQIATIPTLPPAVKK